MNDSKFLALIASTGLAIISSETHAANRDLIEDEKETTVHRNKGVSSIFEDLVDDFKYGPNNTGCSNNGCSGGGSNNGCGSSGSGGGGGGSTWC